MNIFWILVAMKIGHRPVFLVTTILCMCAGVWRGEFHGTRHGFAALILNGVRTSSYQAVIQLSVFNMFFAHKRGRMLSEYLFRQ